MAYKIIDIEGIGAAYAAKLKEAGENTIKEFRHRVPANLYAKMVAINDEKNLCNRIPSVKEIEKMVAQAKEMEPTVKY